MLLLIPNISLFLSGLNFPANSSESVTFDHIYEKLIDISTIDVRLYRYRQLKETAEGVGAIAQLFSLVEMKRRGENSHVLRRKK